MTPSPRGQTPRKATNVLIHAGDVLDEAHVLAGELELVALEVLAHVARGGRARQRLHADLQRKAEVHLRRKWNVRERDMGGLVAEAMKKVDAAVKLPEGYQMVWSGRLPMERP